MKKIIPISTLLLSFYLVIIFSAQQNSVHAQNVTHQIRQIEDGYPETPQKGELIRHKAYHLAYDEADEQPYWVAYILTRNHLQAPAKAERSDNFRADKSVSTGSATPDDYKKSGYDRGHIAPAADMSWSEETMSESFYMSNMSPQKPGFNRGVWKDLEEKVRDWASANDSLYVVAGPVFTHNMGTIGAEGVTVPGFYFKVVMDISAPGYKAIAFYMPNEKSEKGYMAYAISVDELEKITGYNFFAKLPAKLIEPIEAKLDVTQWK